MLIVAACASSPTASFDDTRITEDVIGALNSDHLRGIAVSVTNGRVKLVGLVPSESNRALAIVDAERVPGVVAIDDQIEVSGRPPAERDRRAP